MTLPLRVECYQLGLTHWIEGGVACPDARIWSGASSWNGPSYVRLVWRDARGRHNLHLLTQNGSWIKDFSSSLVLCS